MTERVLRYLGRARNKLWLELTAAYNLTRNLIRNLTRLANLEAAAAATALNRPSPSGPAG